jgi:chromosomal replication initiator protein
MSNEIVTRVLESLRTKVSDFNYRNWFQNLQWEYGEPNQVTVKVPSRFIKDWITDHYLELIKFEFFRQTEQEHTIVFKVERVINRTMELFPEETKAAGPTQQARPVIAVQAVAPKTTTPFGFNSRYRLDNFVVGTSNQLVHAACQAVARQPGVSYNPFYIYSGVGLGKTHLLNAIGLEVHKLHPTWRIVSITGERFTNEVIGAIRFGKTDELRRKYRDTCDLLLIDDIQFIAGKDRTQEEFFHTFNTLYEARKQIVLTSDSLPRNIAKLEERLKSRFSWGLMADIQNPDYETRVAILKRKAEEERVSLSDSVCSFIAENVTTNVRELEGALVRVSAFASLAKLPVTLDLAQEVLKDIMRPSRSNLNVEMVQQAVADFYNLKISDLKSHRRHQSLALPRHIAMYLCKKHLEASLPEIGERFGGKDHTTVLHAVQKIQSHLETNTSLKGDVILLQKSLGV